MLIQNVSSTTQAQAPARLAGDGGPVVVVAAANTQAHPAVAVVLPQTAVSPVAELSPSAAQLRSAVDSINQALKQSNKNLEFTVDAETKNPVVKLVDSETGDVIRQYPSEEALSIARSIDDFQQGMLIKQEA
jgi:flagellar protein FlaG